MLIRGGVNIYPREIEECIFSYSQAAEAAAFSIPDGYLGEKIVA